MFLLNTFLGFLVVQIADILNRNKQSASSPVRFNFMFFIKDNWLKIVLSLALSFSISLSVYINAEEIISELWNGTGDFFIYWIIGAFPEFVLQLLKKRGNVLQPPEVTVKDDTYKRL
jgi:hypothetical protein